MLKILVADNFNIHRIGLVQILVESFPGAIVDEANDVDTLFIKANTENWDLIISGFISPVDRGVEIVQKIKTGSRISIAVCGMEASQEKINCLLNAGASEFIDKGAKASLIKQQVKRILTGGN